MTLCYLKKADLTEYCEIKLILLQIHKMFRQYKVALRSFIGGLLLLNI